MSRLDRVNSLLRNEIANILLLKVNDARIGFISICEVRASKDLRHAYVYYSQIGTEEDKAKTKKGLYSASKFIYLDLKKRLSLATIPYLHFRLDTSLERGSRILDKLNTQI